VRFNKADILFLIFSILILGVILFFPISTDLAIFIRAGEIVAAGGMPYADFIDIKQPTIYYLFALLVKVFGSSAFSLRFFDLLLQSATCFFIFNMIRKNTEDKWLPRLSCLIYSLLYSTLSFNHTLQIESLLPVFLIPMILLIIKQQQSKSGLLIIGLLAGLAASLKYTFGIVILAFPIYAILFSDVSIRTILKRYALTFAGFCLVFGLSFLPFLVTEIREGYSDVIQYLSFYSSNPPIDASFFKESVKSIGRFFGDKFSLLFTSAFILAAIKLKDNVNKKEFRILSAGFVLFCLLSITIFVERKFFEYHFSRLYLPLTIMVAIGSLFIIGEVKKFFGNGVRYFIIGVVLISFLVFQSPLPRWLSLLQPSCYYFTDQAGYSNYYNRPIEGGAVLDSEQRDMADYVRNNSDPDEKIFVASVASSISNYYIGHQSDSKLLLSSFYLNNANIRSWQATALDELLRAKWLVMQEDDPNKFSNGHILTSRQTMLSDEIFGPYISNNFIRSKQIGRFHIYKRNETN
jgi:hypothetical protein